jgi:hypothetical protein
MAANKGGDSKQGLIITLVCFVLLSIILGVVAYYGYADQATLIANEKKAKDEKTSVEKNREYYKFQAALLKAYVGLNQSKKELTEVLPVLRDQWDGNQLDGDDKAEVVNLVKSLDEKVLGWNKGLKKPETTFMEKISKLEGELKSERQVLLQQKDQIDALKEQLKNERDAYVAQLQKIQEDYAKAKNDNLADMKKRADELDTRLKEFATLSDQLGETRRSKEDAVAAEQKKGSRSEAEVRDMKEQILKLQKQLTPVDFLKYDTPKGKIVQVDAKGEAAWINLGSADNVRPQQNLTFSIFSPGTGGKAGQQRKGSLEVVDVLQPHLSMARISEVVDPNRHPILAGDVLINPAWSPTHRMHVAIAGLIDLKGDGNNHIDEFMRLLDKQGVIVDAYLDINDLTIKRNGVALKAGEFGMTVKTDYLILGEMPQIEAREIVDINKAENKQVEAKTNISSKIVDMEVEAKKVGVTVVPLRRFIALTGYQFPHAASVNQGFGYEGRRKAAEEAKEPAKKDEKPAKKDEGDK